MSEAEQAVRVELAGMLQDMEAACKPGHGLLGKFEISRHAFSHGELRNALIDVSLSLLPDAPH